MRGKHKNKYLKPTRIIRGVSENWDVVPEVTVGNNTDLPQNLIHLVYQTWPWLAVDLGVRSSRDLLVEEVPA